MSRETDPGVDVPLVECDLPLGRPDLIVHDELRLSGWAASAKGVSGIAVQIGERQWTAAYGLDTPQLPGRLPGIAGADRAGFLLAIDTSSWDPGSRFVTVAAFDREGGRAAVEGVLVVHPLSPPADPLGHLEVLDGEVVLEVDAPADPHDAAVVEGPLDISGWAYAQAGIESVVVTLDGCVQYEALRPIARPDLLARYGWQVASQAGFALRLDPVDCSPGRHHLAIAAFACDGAIAGVEREVECRAVPARSAVSLPSVVEARGGADRDLRMPGEAELSPAERSWQDRALLAEADAALSRAEARLARTAEERARRDLRAALES